MNTPHSRGLPVIPGAATRSAGRKLQLSSSFPGSAVDNGGRFHSAPVSVLRSPSGSSAVPSRRASAASDVQKATDAKSKQERLANVRVIQRLDSSFFEAVEALDALDKQRAAGRYVLHKPYRRSESALESASEYEHPGRSGADAVTHLPEMTTRSSTHARASDGAAAVSSDVALPAAAPLRPSSPRPERSTPAQEQQQQQPQQQQLHQQPQPRDEALPPVLSHHQQPASPVSPSASSSEVNEADAEPLPPPLAKSTSTASNVSGGASALSGADPHDLRGGSSVGSNLSRNGSTDLLPANAGDPAIVSRASSGGSLPSVTRPGSLRDLSAQQQQQQQQQLPPAAAPSAAAAAPEAKSVHINEASPVSSPGAARRKTKGSSPVVSRSNSMATLSRLPSEIWGRNAKNRYPLKYGRQTVDVLSAYFREMDIGGSGRVTSEEFHKSYERRSAWSKKFGNIDNWTFAEGYFDLLDQKKLGFFTFFDVLRANFPFSPKRDLLAMMEYGGFQDSVSRAARSETMSTQETKEFTAIYEVLDHDNTGAIPVEGLRVYLTNLGYLTEQEARTFLKSMDADGNGTISLAEFLSSMKGHWVQLPEIALSSEDFD